MTAALLLFALLFQAAPQSSPPDIRPTLRDLRDKGEERLATFGAAPELTNVKHQLRDWVESRLGATNEGIDTAAFAEGLNTALRKANLICTEFVNECDTNFLGFVDDVRVSREGEYLFVVTSVGLRCGFDESAYIYGWQGQQWRRIWEYERNTYAQGEYLPQSVHEALISAPDASQRRLLLLLGSAMICRGSFKDVYVRAWQMDASYKSQQVLDWKTYANDGYPPVRGRVQPDDVIVQFTADGMLSGQTHTAVRHFKIEQGKATQVDPIAARPRDFVLEWLSAPWEESRTRSESPALEASHTELRSADHVGDFPEPVRRCTSGENFWQVGTNLFEGPKRYYRVRWRQPFTFSMVEISDTPFADCTADDPLGETGPSPLRGGSQ